MTDTKTVVTKARHRTTRRYSLEVLPIYFLLLIDVVLLNNGLYIMPAIGWGIVVVYTLFLSPESIFLVMMVIAPVSHAFQLQSSITTFPILATVFLLKLLKRNTKIEIEFLMIYILLVLLNGVSTIIQYGTPRFVIPFFLYFLMTYFASRYLFLTEDLYELCIKCFLISVFIVCIGSKALPIASDYMNNSTDYSERNSGFSSVWDFGQNISVSIIAVLMAIKRKKISLSIAVLLLCFFTYFLIDTGLFTGLIGIVFTIVLYPYLSKNHRKNTLRDYSFSTIVVLISFCIGYFVIFPRMNIIRHGMGFYDNGRFALWKYYINLFCSEIRIMYAGIGADSITAYASIHGMRTSHNFIIEKLIEFGVLGSILLVMGIRAIVRNNSLIPTKNSRAIYVMAYLAMGMVQGVSGSDVIFLFLIIASCMFLSDKNKCDFD